MPAIRATVEGSGEDLPLSHLPTACWVTPRRAASSAWLMPCFLRHCLSSSENDIENAPLQNGILPVGSVGPARVARPIFPVNRILLVISCFYYTTKKCPCKVQICKKVKKSCIAS